MNKHTLYMRQWRKKHTEENQAYQKDYRQKHLKQVKENNRRVYKKFLNILHGLKINGCSICGYDKYDGSLVFHHVNSENKKFGLNTYGIRYYSNEKIVEELNKCILLCANCHREIHAKGRI